MDINHNDPKIHAYKVTALATDVCGEVKFKGAIVDKDKAKAAGYHGMIPVDICHAPLVVAPVVQTLNESNGKAPTKDADVKFNKMDRFAERLGTQDAPTGTEVNVPEKKRLFEDMGPAAPDTTVGGPETQERVSLLGAPETLARTATESVVVTAAPVEVPAEAAGETVAAVEGKQRKGRRKAAAASTEAVA